MDLARPMSADQEGSRWLRRKHRQSSEQESNRRLVSTSQPSFRPSNLSRSVKELVFDTPV